MKTVVKNISELIQTESSLESGFNSKEMSKLNTIKEAFLEYEDGIITSFGNMEEWKA